MSDHKLQSIEAKLEAVIDKLHVMNVTMARNTESLIIHEKRTDIAERKMESLNGRIDDLKDRENKQFKELSEYVQEKFCSIEDKISPIKTHVEVMSKVFNLVWKVIIPCFVGVLGILYKVGVLKI